MRRLILGALLCVPFAGHAESLSAVQACMQANVSKELRAHAFTLTTTESDGATRVISGRMALTSTQSAEGQFQLRAVLRVSQPDSFAGAAYLVREVGDPQDSAMYVYLPSIRAVRAVYDNFGDGALLGSDFSYRDLKQLQSGFSGSQLSLEGEDRVEGRRSFRLTLTPASGTWEYSSVKFWVDAQSCVPLKAQYLQGEHAVKELSVPATGLRQAGKSWYATQLRMNNLDNGTQTVLSLADIDAPKIPSPELFNVQTFFLPGSL